MSYCSPAPRPTQGPDHPSRPNFNTHAETNGTGRYHPLPFSALPHQLRRDLKGNQTAISLACALLQYAGVKPYCYPTTARLAADLGVCQNTIRAALRALQSAGWVRIVLGANQPNGRRIWLTWLEPGTPANVPTRAPRQAVPQLSDPLQPAGAPLQSFAVPLQPAAASPPDFAAKDRTFEEFNDKRNVVSPTQIPDAPAPPVPPPLPRPALPLPTPTLAHDLAPVAAPPLPRPPAPTPALPTSVGTQAPTPVMPLLDELKTLSPTTTPGEVRRLAARLAAALHDEGSLGGYISVLSKVVAGTLGRDRLLSAYKAGLKSVGKAARAGAIFMWHLSNYTPPPKPSEVRYYQTRTTDVPRHVCNTNREPAQCMAGSGTGPGASLAEPAPTAEDLAALRAMAANPRHPLRVVAAARLSELGL